MMDAVVLGSGLNALGVLRSLGARGLKLGLVSRQESGIAAFSRFAKRHLILSSADHQPQLIAERLGLERAGTMLFLTEEWQVASCLADGKPWQDVFKTYFFTPQVAGALLSKAQFDALARSSGAAVKETVVLNDAKDMTMLQALRLPVVIKPVMREQPANVRLKRARKVESLTELRGLTGKALAEGATLVAQEWIDGEDSDIYFNFVFLDAAGRLCSSFVGRKLLCWPPSVGGTAACSAAPEHHDRLTGMTVEFLERIGFRGLLGLEYKKDKRDGKFYMVEPTVYRTDYQHEVATLSGHNFLFDVYTSCMYGHAQASSPYRRDKYWVDFPAARYSVKASRGDDRKLAGLHRVDAHFRWTDPLPGLVHYRRFLANAALGLFRRLRRGTRKPPVRVQ